MTGQPPAVRPAEISQIIAWCARLTRPAPALAPPRPPPTSPPRPACSSGSPPSAPPGWASSDIDLARQAAAGARAAANASTPLAAAGTVTLEDQP